MQMKTKKESAFVFLVDLLSRATKRNPLFCSKNTKRCHIHNRHLQGSYMQLEPNQAMGARQRPSQRRTAANGSRQTTRSGVYVPNQNVAVDAHTHNLDPQTGTICNESACAWCENWRNVDHTCRNDPRQGMCTHTCLPSGEKVTPITVLEWPMPSAKHAPDEKSHNLTR
jgi:hypothetical protein